MLIPYATDAPVYHRPLATGGLMLLAIAMFVVQMTVPGFTGNYQLVYGELNPLQWLTSIFMHLDLSHLLGNLLFLWVFGLVIEGKVGWWRMLVIFLGIGVAECALEQLWALQYGKTVAISGSDWTLPAFPSGSLGASAAIFGLLAMAMLWAPENEVHFMVVVRWHGFGTFEVPLLLTGFIFVALDFLRLWFLGFGFYSAVFHLMGAALGGATGYWMLRTGRVDGEGYDLISIQQGKRGQRVKTEEEIRQQQARAEQTRLKKRLERKQGLARVQHYLDQGHYEMALARFRVLQRSGHLARMPEKLLIRFIRGFSQSADQRARAIPLMEQYLKWYEPHRETITLGLARLYLDLHQRHTRATALISRLDPETLNGTQRGALRGIVADIGKLTRGGAIDLREE